MDPVDDDATFLKGLVKAARQKVQRVDWVDRDGTARTTNLTQAEASRLTQIASAQRVSSAEVLKRAAHVPNANKPGTV